MERMNEKQKGITLIALVVTIVILLILAGVTIGFLSGEDGLISRITKSIDTGKIEDYKEVIELDRLGTEILAGTKDMTDKEYMDNYENDLKKDAENGNLKGSTVTRKNEGTVRVVTPEGYVFDATREGVEYIGKQGEEDENLPEIKDANIDFSCEPSGWTTGEVTVTITPKDIILTDGYYLQYSVNNTKEWKNYEKEFKVEENETTIYARVINKLDESKGTATTTIKNIDKKEPAVNEELTAPTRTTTSISLSTTVTDELSGLGKIIWYYKESGEENYQKVEDGYEAEKTETGETTQQTKTKTIENLTSGKTYNMYAEVYDVAGNKTRTPEESETVNQATIEMPGKEKITITPSTTDWTNEDVTFEITTEADESIFKLQYTIDPDGEWTDYDASSSEKPTLKANGTMYARLVEKANETNVSENATSTVDKIDKTAPTINSPLSGTVDGTSSITLSTEVTDENSGLGKIIWYYTVGGTTNNETDTYQVEGPTAGLTTKQSKSHELVNLSNETTYELYAEVYDVAGNYTRTPDKSNHVSLTTESDIPAASSILITPSTTNWTNQDVTFTITTTANTDSFKLQYATSESGPWADYVDSNKPKLTANGTIYARLLNKTDATKVSENAEYEMSKIDKSRPSTSWRELEITDSTTTSLTVKTTVSDTGSGLGKIIWYYTTGSTTNHITTSYKSSGPDAGATGSQTKTTTIYGLTPNSAYTVYAEYYDVAGNRASGYPEYYYTASSSARHYSGKYPVMTEWMSYQYAGFRVYAGDTIHFRLWMEDYDGKSKKTTRSVSAKYCITDEHTITHTYTFQAGAYLSDIYECDVVSKESDTFGIYARASTKTTWEYLHWQISVTS